MFGQPARGERHAAIAMHKVRRIDRRVSHHADFRPHLRRQPPATLFGQQRFRKFNRHRNHRAAGAHRHMRRTAPQPDYTIVSSTGALRKQNQRLSRRDASTTLINERQRIGIDNVVRAANAAPSKWVHLQRSFGDHDGAFDVPQQNERVD